MNAETNKTSKFMKNILLTLFCAIGLGIAAGAQNLPVNWEEITGPDFKLAIQKSEGVCIIPLGVLEKHGPQLPIGCDALLAKGIAQTAAETEYAVVFPFYYFGQINEAKQQPGTVAYSPELCFKLLEETCKEVARNGFKKIILYNYHGGNKAFMEYFCQCQLYEKKDYIVYLAQHNPKPEAEARMARLRKQPKGQHADETESANIMYLYPNLPKMNTTRDESGEDMDRLPLKNLYTGIWWYAKFPNHYAADATGASKELGEVSIKDRADVLCDMIRAVKADTKGPALMKEYFEYAEDPTKTPIFE